MPYRPSIGLLLEYLKAEHILLYRLKDYCLSTENSDTKALIQTIILLNSAVIKELEETGLKEKGESAAGWPDWEVYHTWTAIHNE